MHGYEQMNISLSKNCEKTGSHPGLNRGLRLKLSVLYHLSYGHRMPASLHNSQYHSVCAVRTLLGIDR